MTRKTSAYALRAALAEQPAEQSAKHGEPVAYMLPRDGDDCAIFREPSSFATRYSPKGWTPLYTAPQPAKPAEQEPVALRHQNMEHMAEEAECVAMCLNDRGVPVREGAKSLSLWGRVEQYAKPRFINGMHTKDPSISREHLLALAKVCGIVGNYTAREFVDSVTGYAQVVLRDPAVQEAFVEANAHMLYTAPQPAKRAPLTDEELGKIINANWGVGVWQMARAIERAHGIGEQE